MPKRSARTIVGIKGNAWHDDVPTILNHVYSQYALSFVATSRRTRSAAAKANAQAARDCIDLRSGPAELCGLRKHSRACKPTSRSSALHILTAFCRGKFMPIHPKRPQRALPLLVHARRGSLWTYYCNSWPRPAPATGRGEHGGIWCIEVLLCEVAPEAGNVVHCQSGNSS